MFEVEWTSDVPEDECGDLSLDEAVEHQRYFNSEEAAWKFARKVHPKDFFGSVRITECHRERYEPGLPGTYIEYDGESEHYEGEG